MCREKGSSGASRGGGSGGGGGGGRLVGGGGYGGGAYGGAKNVRGGSRKERAMAETEYVKYKEDQVPNGLPVPVSALRRGGHRRRPYRQHGHAHTSAYSRPQPRGQAMIACAQLTMIASIARTDNLHI